MRAAPPFRFPVTQPLWSGLISSERGRSDATYSGGEINRADAFARSWSVEANDLPTKSVIIFSDRAEVKKTVAVNLLKGISELLIQNVSNVIERDSVRVDAVGVTIQEVQLLETPLDSLIESSQIRKLEKKQKELEMRKTTAEDEVTNIAKRIEVLDGVAAQIAVAPSMSSGVARRASLACMQPASNTAQKLPNLGLLVNDDALVNLMKFIEYYGETTRSLKTELRKHQSEEEAIVEELEELEREISQLRCSQETISITVDAEIDRDVEVLVSYQVYCASWKPTYDIRASSNEDTDRPVVQLCYYGLIEQNTGEMWSDCEVVLSTAAPSLPGNAPHLPTLTAAILRHSQRHRALNPRKKLHLSAASEEDMGFGSFDNNEMVDAAAYQRLSAHPQSSEENSIVSHRPEYPVCTAFAVPRPMTIPSTGVEHKVLVAQIELPCSYHHDSVPSKCSSAFLSALVTNASPLPILPAIASIYLNNSFISKTHLSAVFPGEEFSCSLGVDPSVKVEYKCPHKGQAQVGFVSKSILHTNEQVISIRNAKVSQDVIITVREQIPKAIDDKVKVNLVLPELKKAGEARLNKDNNLEWTTRLMPGVQKDLLVKYTIEHPLNETVAFKAYLGSQTL